MCKSFAKKGYSTKFIAFARSIGCFDTPFSGQEMWLLWNMHQVQQDKSVDKISFWWVEQQISIFLFTLSYW